MTPECPLNVLPGLGCIAMTTLVAAVHGLCHTISDDSATGVYGLHFFLYLATMASAVRDECRHDGMFHVLLATIINCGLYFGVATLCTAGKNTMKKFIAALPAAAPPAAAPPDAAPPTHLELARKWDNDDVIGAACLAMYTCVCAGTLAALATAPGL